jgi:hypothetical protein
MGDEEVLMWGKNGGVNVGEGENKRSLKRFFHTWKKRVGFHFCFPPVFSPTFFPHIFPHVKIGVVVLLLLLFSFFTF